MEGAVVSSCLRCRGEVQLSNFIFVFHSIICTDMAFHASPCIFPSLRSGEKVHRDPGTSYNSGLSRGCDVDTLSTYSFAFQRPLLTFSRRPAPGRA